MLILFFALVMGVVNAAPPAGLENRGDDAFAELQGKFTLRFSDAVTGQPILNGQVSFEGQTGRTDSEGAVTFEKPGSLAPEDIRKARFQKQGYMSTPVEIEFLAGALFFNR